MNEVIQNIITRRSCKSFRPDLPSEETVQAIVEAGLYAASGLGRQSPVILAVTNREDRDALSRLNARYDPMKRPDPFYSAPVVLAVLVPKEAPTGIYDGSLVIGNMMLAAHSLGMGSCWIHRAKEVFEDEKGKAILQKAGLTGEYEGIGHCVIGYAAQPNTGIPPRKAGRVYRLD